MRRENIQFAAGGERVKFDTHRVMLLNEAKSENLDKKHWVLNPTIPSTLKTVQTLILDRVPFRRLTEPIVFNSVNLILDGFKERLVNKRSARQLLEGKKIELLVSIQNLADRFGLGSLVPPGPPQNIFGVAHYQNNTFETIEIFTGLGKTKNRFAEVYQYKGRDKLKFWEGRCKSLEGTNGELYKPFVNKTRPLRIFLGMLCRGLSLDPVSDEPIEVQDGLMALEYEFSNRVFLGARNNPSNKCFCQDVRTYDCQYDGLINMGPCFFDSPLYFSKANMKGVDRRIRSLINDSSVEYDVPDKQSFYLDQTTGSVLKANITLLSSFKLVKQPYMRDMATIRDIAYVPFFLASEQITLPYSITRPLKYLQVMMNYYQQAFMAGAAGGAIVLLLKFTILR